MSFKHLRNYVCFLKIDLFYTVSCKPTFRNWSKVPWIPKMCSHWCHSDMSNANRPPWCVNLWGIYGYIWFRTASQVYLCTIFWVCLHWEIKTHNSTIKCRSHSSIRRGEGGRGSDTSFLSNLIAMNSSQHAHSGELQCWRWALFVLTLPPSMLVALLPMRHPYQTRSVEVSTGGVTKAKWNC